MELIIAPRRMGKTEKLIHRSGETYDTIVCGSTKEANRIFQKATNLKLKIPYPLTYDQFLKRDFEGQNISGFLIDNLEHLLRYISREIPINAISMNIPFKFSMETGVDFPANLTIDTSKFDEDDIKDIKESFKERFTNFQSGSIS